MSHDLTTERFFEALINGDRPQARTIVREYVDAGASPEKVITDLFWPTYENIEKLWRNDHLTNLAYKLSTRLLRTLVDQAALRLTFGPTTKRKVFACCGQSESEELAAQMAVDLLEASGFNVTFAAGGIPADEILATVHESRPDVLLMFASAASDLPGIRHCIDTLREIGACPRLQIAVGGGVFNRAEGLAEEIGADLWACDPLELVDNLINEAETRAAANYRTVGKQRQKLRAAA
jgi:MerR family transcriptional regulator, light-induced transcriptional regulator